MTDMTKTIRNPFSHGMDVKSVSTFLTLCISHEATCSSYPNKQSVISVGLQAVGSATQPGRLEISVND